MVVVEGLGLWVEESLGIRAVGVGFWTVGRGRSEGLELRPRGLEREVERRGLVFSFWRGREGEGKRREAERGRGRTVAPSSPPPRRVAMAV